MKDEYVCKNTSECLKEQDQKVLADFQQLQDVQKKLVMSYIQGLLKTAFVDKAVRDENGAEAERSDSLELKLVADFHDLPNETKKIAAAYVHGLSLCNI